jgi:hypothetical protein
MVQLDRKFFPALSNFHENIRAELDSRFSRFGRENVPHSFWTRFISNTYRFYPSQDMDRKNIWVLTGGILNDDGSLRGGFQSVYNYHTSGRTLRPMPGITGLSIETTGQYGSIRKATIDWTCPSVQDLEELEPYFMRIGVSAFIDFGYSHPDAIANAFNISQDVSKRSKDMIEIFKNPKKLYENHILASNGKYDAIIGRVSNFTYSVNEDGSYTCTTDVTAMGELMLGINLRRQARYADPNKSDKRKTLQEYLKSKDMDNDVVDKSKQNNTYGRQVIKKGSDIWITWGFFEDFVLNRMLSMESGADGKIKTFILDSSGVLITNDKYLFSTDPDVMLLGKGGSKNPGGNVDVFDTEFFDKDGYSGIMRNIYVNLKVIKEELGNAETFKEGIQNILNKIATSAGNLWSFEFYSDPTEENKLKIIDVNYNNPWEEDAHDYIEFNRYDGTGIIKEISLTTKVTQQLAVKFFVAKNKEQSQNDLVVNDMEDSGIRTLAAGENKDSNLEHPDFWDLVYSNLRVPDDALKSDNSGETDVSDVKKNVDNIGRKLAEQTPEERENTIGGVVETKKIEGATFYYFDSDKAEEVFEFIRRKTTDNIRRHRIPLYSIEASVTLDGISGVLPGNVFRIANIPKNYYDNGVFQIMSVSHDISGENWNTTFTAIYRILDFSKRELINKNIKAPSGL